MMNETEKNTDVLPKKGLDYPIWNFLLIPFPQIVMVLLFLQGYSLIHGNMGETESYYETVVISLMSANILLLTGYSVYQLIRRKVNGIIFYSVLLSSQISVLWILCYLFDKSIPDGVNDFIFPQFRYIGYLFTFMMPGIFYGITGIANAVTLKNWRTDLIVTTSGVFGTPIVLYLISTLLRIVPGASHLMSTIPVILVVSWFLVMSVLFFIFLMRFFTKGFAFIDKQGIRAKISLVFIISIVLPICGLLLNRSIPFPVDFQDWRVYAMTVLNGIMLCIPLTGNKKIDLVLFAGKGIFYPFAVYFFLVFLPFLPLSLIAIMAMGVGFLMLSPTALFFIQTKKIALDFIFLSKKVNKFILASLLFLCIITIPVFITVNALLDKRVIYQAVNYVYSSDYTAEIHIEKDLPRIKRALQGLYDFKHGIEMPYLTLYYQWLVFDNLVLPDKKINKVYQDIFGEDLPKGKESMWGSGGFRGGRSDIRGLNVREKDPEIKVVSVSNEIKENGNGFAKCLVDLEIKNTGHRDLSEYIAEIKLPEGVFVSGYYLKVGKEKVPGRLFEKKSALWIYEKISNVKRDPGLLYYIAPDKLRFHVFPFSAGEIRHTGIEFLFPEKTSQQVVIDNQAVILENKIQDDTADQPLFSLDLQESKLIKRFPVLHFIIDYSAAAPEPDWTKLADIARRFECHKYYLSLANISSTRIAEDQNTESLRSMKKTGDGNLPAKTGGFMVEKALKKEILLWHKLPSVEEFPVFIIVTDKDGIFKPADYEYFDELIPETENIYISSFGGNVKSISLHDGQETPFNKLVVNDVRLLKDGRIIADKKLAVSGINEKSDNEYFKAVSLLNDYKKTIYNPSLKEENFAKLVNRSKKSGIMIPLTSYIVLESAAQWAMLEKTEKEKLGNLSELEIEEIRSPEPGLFSMILAFFAGLGILKFINRKIKK